MKVLFLGHCRYETVKIVAQHVKNAHPDWQLHVLDLVRMDESNPIDPFDRNISSKEQFESFSDREAKSFVKEKGLLFNAIKEGLRNFFSGFNKSYHTYCRNVFQVNLKTSFFASYDVIHLHYLDVSTSKWLKFIPAEKHVIASWWGSDAYQDNDSKNLKAQKEIMKRANMASCHSEEMKEVILSKVGREFDPKFSLILFGMKDWVFEKIQTVEKGKARNSFCSKRRIDPNKKLVQVCYSRSKDANHLEVAKALKHLSASAKEQFFFIFSMTYGFNKDWEDYYLQIKTELEKHNIHHAFLLDYMSENDVLEQHAACDIMLNIRKSDALNNSMMEHLSLGNLVISGSWLNYQILVKGGIFMPMVDEIIEIPELLNSYLEKEDDFRIQCQFNPSIIQQKFVASAWAEQWLSLYPK